MLSSMSPKRGRVGVVMPHGVLFRGAEEARIRECIVKGDMLEAVIGLPTNLFYSTSIPACLLIFRAKKATERKDSVLFVDASQQYVKGKNQNHLAPEVIEDVVSAYRSEPAGVPSRLVPLSELKERYWDLNVARYVGHAAAEAVAVADVLGRVRQARLLLDEAEDRLDQLLRKAGYE